MKKRSIIGVVIYHLKYTRENFLATKYCAEVCSLLFYALTYLFFIFALLWKFVSIFQCKNGNNLRNIGLYRSGGRPLLNGYLCERDSCYVEDGL
jgi:hypothetical protein